MDWKEDETARMARAIFYLNKQAIKKVRREIKKIITTVTLTMVFFIIVFWVIL